MQPSTIRDVSCISDQPNNLRRPDCPVPATWADLFRLMEHGIDEGHQAAAVLGGRFQTKPRRTR